MKAEITKIEVENRISQLEEVAEYLHDRADVRDTPQGPVPDSAMEQEKNVRRVIQWLTVKLISSQ